MKLKDVLQRHQGDRDKLIVALTKLRNDETKLKADAEGLNSMVQLLMQAASEASDTNGLNLAGLLLRGSTLLAEDLDDAQQRILLESRYVRSLLELLDGVTRTLRLRKQLAPTQEEPVRAVLDALGDIANMAIPADGGGRPQKGRDLHGTAIIPKLVAFLVLPAEGMLAAKHSASATLLEFLPNSRPNCELLGATPDSAELFGTLLPSCGDVATQIDLMEALYRCAKAGALREEHRAPLKPEFQAALDALAARSTKGMDLAAELRRLLVGYNRALGAEATVYCAQARSMAVNGIDGLAAPGKWVDFGLRSLALGLHLADEDEEDAELEIVDFPYADVTRVQTSPGATSGNSKLTISLRTMPKALRSTSQQFQGAGTLVMQFARGDLVNLMSHAPKVAAAMKAAGVAISSDGALSGGGNGLDMSQRSRKCSTGFTVYNKQVQQGEAPGRSSGRAPLQLTRSGHTPAGSLNTNNGNQAGTAAAAANANQQPASRPKSILRRASSPAREPTAAEATLAPPGQGQEQQQEQQQQEEEQQEQPAAAVPAAPEEEQEPPAAAFEQPEEPLVQPEAPEEGAAEEHPSKQPSWVEATMEEPAADEEEQQRPAGGGKAGGTQRRGRQASQRPAASDRTAATDPGAAKPAPTGTEVSSPAQAAKQRAEQRAAAAALKASQRPLAMVAAPKPSQRKPAAAAVAAAADPYADGLSSDEDEEPQPVPAAGKKAAAGSKKQTQPSQRAKAAAGGGRRRMQGGAGGKKGAAAAAAGRQGRRAVKPSPEDAIETQTQEAGVEDGAAEDKAAVSPTPSWMHDADAGQAAPGGAGPSYSSSDSESELQHDHASKQELFAKQEQAKPQAKPQPAAAALAAAAKAAKVTAAKAAADEAVERSKGKGKAAAAPGSGSKAAAAAVKRAAAAAKAATAEESDGSETEADEEPQPRQLAKKAAGAAAPKGAAAKKAAAGKAGPGKAGPGKAGPGKAAAATKPAAAGGKRPARAAAVTASAKLAEGDEECSGSGSESEGKPVQRQPTQRRGKAPAAAEQREEAGGGDSFVFRPPAAEAKKPAGAAAKRRSPAKVGGPIKSPLKRMQGGFGGTQAAKKRAREAAAAAVAEAELQDEEEAHAAIPTADVLEMEPLAPEAEAEAAAEAAAQREVGRGRPLVQESELQLEQEEAQEPLAGATEEQPMELEPSAPAAEEAAGPEGGSEEESEGEEEEEEAPAGYKSEGTRHLAGWTNFRAAEADVPDMLVPEEDLAGITKRFKFTAVKEAPAAGAGGGSGGRSKAERKAAAAGAARKAPSPLLGLTGARPALKSARLTTTLSQEGLAGLAGPSGGAAAGRGATSRPAPLQKPGAPGAAGAAKAGGKRALESLGQPAAAAKRQKATKPLAAVGGRGGRKAPGAAAAAAAAGLGEGGMLDESQGLSLHGLLQSAQRRAAEATQPSQEEDSDSEDEGPDMATLQAMMLEVVRKRKHATQRKQAQMVAELEAEAAAALAAKEAELAEAQRSLDAAVAGRFAQLEKQLDAKMREIDSATLTFQSRLNELWEEYRGMYDTIAQAATDAEAAASKQRTAAARGLEQLRESLAAKAVDVGRKIERANKRAGKMPELAQMLAPFLG